jgi:hypothetical protein
MSDTLLAHLAISLVEQKENLATEAVAFILNRSSDARGALHGQLTHLLGETRPFARVATQTVLGDESRPDVALLDEDGRTTGFVEAKFWAGLTDAQPVGYVTRLAADGGGVLIVLAPERRLPLLRVEIGERLRHASLLTSDGPHTMTAGSVRVGLLSWTRLLAALRHAAANDRAVLSDVEQLAGLVARFETDGFVPLTRADLDDLDVPRRTVALANLGNEIVDNADVEGLLSVKGFKQTHFMYGTGRYFSIRSLECWLGLDNEVWALRGRSPLWICFRGASADKVRKPLRSWFTTEPPRAYDFKETVYVPVLIAVGAEKDRVVGDALRQVRELHAALAATA